MVIRKAIRVYAKCVEDGTKISVIASAVRFYFPCNICIIKFPDDLVKFRIISDNFPDVWVVIWSFAIVIIPTASIFWWLHILIQTC